MPASTKAAVPFTLWSLVFTVYAPSILQGVGEAASGPILPLYARHGLNATDGVIGAVVSGRAVGEMAFSIPSGHIASQLGVKNTMLLGGVVATVAGLGCAAATDIPTLVVSVILFGVAMALMRISRQTYVADVCPPSRRGKVSLSASLLALNCSP